MQLESASVLHLAAEYTNILHERMAKKQKPRKSSLGALGLLSPRGSRDNSPRTSADSPRNEVACGARVHAIGSSGDIPQVQPRGRGWSLGSSSETPIKPRHKSESPQRSPRSDESSSSRSSRSNSPRARSVKKIWKSRPKQQIRTETLCEGVNVYEYAHRMLGRCVLLEYDPAMVGFSERDKVIVITMSPDAIMDIAQVVNKSCAHLPLCITAALYTKIRGMHMFDHMEVVVFAGLD
jgi:hypothetical protein